MADPAVLSELWAVIDDRFLHQVEGSYINRLISDVKGPDRILEKVGEEAAEFIIAAKNGVPTRITEEGADLLFHVLIALRASGCSLDELLEEISRRRK
jgi:phosphoribosyl-ATP pyrophosphohydrolase